MYIYICKLYVRECANQPAFSEGCATLALVLLCYCCCCSFGATVMCILRFICSVFAIIFTNIAYNYELQISAIFIQIATIYFLDFKLFYTNFSHILHAFRVL